MKPTYRQKPSSSALAMIWACAAHQDVEPATVTEPPRNYEMPDRGAFVPSDVVPEDVA